ncbi:site-2 protease family protein [Haloimpatiens sp. FM7330]|uniref:site-2 protease family protein n=1 Tax=Haloimpatiens sp. FM7330 TaxID=3298610 RepID=UPI00363EB2A1
MIPAILVAFTVHEYAHAKMADKLGDKTPKFQGRLTLNPLSHIDIFGFIMILLVGFGWAKPVETNPRAFKNYYKDDLKVSFAGPLANLISAFIFALVFGFLSKFLFARDFGVMINTLNSILYIIIQLVISINCMLFIFNLIPIPGLDGFHILRDLFPKFFYNVADTMYRYQVIFLIVFIVPIFGGNSLADFIVLTPASFIMRFFDTIAAVIF